jgi:4'-phosphopantetheinyl transferase EntD
MPLSYRETIADTIQILLWEISESEQELQESLALSNTDLERLSKRKSNMHRKGYLAIRQLLKTIEVQPLTLQYNPRGAPYLIDGRFISITHTKNVAAVALSTISVGIDLENYQEKIKKISPHFLHSKESNDLKKVTDIQFLTQIWTAKEALYKAFRTPGIHFKKQLLIDPFEEGVKEVMGTIFHQKKEHKYTLHFRYFNNYCLTLATPV